MLLSYKDVLDWWQSNTLNTVDDYKIILDNFQIIFATNTSNIEGANINYHTAREVFEGDKLSGYSGSFETLYLVRNQKFAFEFILKSLINKIPITSDFIKKIHKILMYGGYDATRWNKGERPGTYKVNDYCVRVNDVGSLPEDVETDINSLLSELSSTSITDVLKASAYFHAVFESIHPFADGNGRVGRTLLNYFLMQHDYPPMVIFDEDKETYYMALEVFNRTEEISGMVKFFEEQTIKTWEHKIFNPIDYISSKINILLVPTASLATCRTKEDCDALLERLGVRAR